MKRGGIWITVVGTVIIIGSVIGGAVMAIAGLHPMVAFDDSQITVSGPGNSLEHHFEAGQEMQLYTYGADGAYIGETPNCEIDGPAPVGEGSSSRSSWTVGAQSRVSFASILFTESGTYRITCDQSGVTVAPPVSPLGIMGGVGGIMLALFGGTLGFIMLALGIVLWIVGARKQARAS